MNMNMKELPNIMPTIALSHAIPVLNELERYGYSRAQLFAELDIALPQAEADTSDVLLSATDFSQLYGHSCRLLEALTSGRQDDSRLSKDARDMMLHCIISSRTLREAIERATTYCGMVSPVGEVLQLRENERSVTLIVDMHRHERDSASLLVCLSAMNMLHQVFSWLVGRILRLQAVELSYPDPQSPVVPGTLASQPLLWGAKHDALVFPVEYLALPVVRGAAELEQIIDYSSFDIQHCTGHLQTLSARLRALLTDALQKNMAPMQSATAAQMLHISAATLRRNLQKEGSSYAEILRECQHARALHLVKCTDTPIAEIAIRTGYSDDRAFRRAFRSWTGCSPSACRDEAQAAGGS
ncbi:MAG: AraC family transcriptional regulator ligand-binding domain-containing protein [Pseudomonadales bacterium]|nr:AraC family transcriptional regulator ligand-binding domain-containing protein [Pseudomonadales bacterium]